MVGQLYKNEKLLCKIVNKYIMPDMSDDSTKIRGYFTRLGFKPEVADIYAALYKGGPQTLSQLARSSGVERTHIYRLLDPLRESNLVEVESRYKHGLYRAAPITNLRILLGRKEEELRDLQLEQNTIEQLLARPSHPSAPTGVQFYEGLEGVKQMLWNQLGGTSENLSILHMIQQVYTGLSFFENFARVSNERGLQFRSVVGDTFIQSLKVWYDRHSNERLRDWQGRVIANSTFPIAYNTIIYDDIVGYYNWKDNKGFGIEIHSADIANSQRRFFELLWKEAAPLGGPHPAEAAKAS